MSGIVGILNIDGTPVDRELLSAMTQSLAFRGPDSQNILCEGGVGFGHTLLITANESANEHQPTKFDGNFWITADARIDARAELVRKLQSQGRKASLERPDAELILHAYCTWGAACVDHLLGDFAFAIWDAGKQKLFCARDQFGVKPFFYALTKNSLLFSNTLNCLRAHPAVSDKLNDLAIADFLLFDFNQDLSTSAFADIQRLPPAHTLEFDGKGLSIRRYWTLPEQKSLRFKQAQECLDAFREVFDAAVGDRMRSGSAGITLSGGLDSTAVAVSARRIADQRGGSFDLRAVSYVFDKLIPHDERRYAGLAADALRIPIEFIAGDDDALYHGFGEPKHKLPEPMHTPLYFADANPFVVIAPRARVAFTGFGGDPVLGSYLSGHVRRMIRAKQFGRLAGDIARFLVSDGRLSRLYIRTRLRRWFAKEEGPTGFPTWLRPELEKRFSLRERWEKIDIESNSNQSARPEAYGSITSSFWTSNFESLDQANTGISIEACHPFFDVRVVKFLISLAALPWCSDKEILRRSSKGILPDAVRLRRKSPLSTDPIWALLKKPESAWIDKFEPHPMLNSYVERDKIPAVYRVGGPWEAWVNLRPISLNFWLQMFRPVG